MAGYRTTIAATLAITALLFASQCRREFPVTTDTMSTSTASAAATGATTPTVSTAETTTMLHQDVPHNAVTETTKPTAPPAATTTTGPAIVLSPAIPGD